MRKLALVLLTIELACWSETSPPNPAVDAIFQKFQKSGSPGCALSVIRDSRIEYKRAYGMADLDHDVPLTTTSVFHVASISKQFTAAAIVLLALDGKLSLDDPVRKYVPELPDFGVPITLRHLIHHTSGLRDQWSLLGLAGWRYSLDLITDNDVLDVMSRQNDLNFPPGDKHLYCNTGYTLLAQVVKRVSGQSFREFTNKRIFEPLGMKNTHFRDDHAEIVKNIALGYAPRKGAFSLSVTNFDTVGATSLLTTVEDLALWDQNFYEPRVGGPALLNQILQRGRLNSGKELDYAFGLVHEKYKGLTTVDHGGADAGYRADLLRFPEQHFSVACLCNLSSASPGELARKVADVYLAGLLKEAAPKGESSSISVTPEELGKRAGLYWRRDGDGFRKFVVESGVLKLVLPDETYELKALAQDRFRMMAFPQEFHFEGTRIADGEITPDTVWYEAVQPWTPSVSDLKVFAGAYTSSELDAIWRIDLRDGKLMLKRLKSKPEALDPMLQDVFLSGTGAFRFKWGKDGRVSGFVLNAGRVRNIRFERQWQ